MWSQPLCQLVVLHWMDNSPILKIYFPQCICFLKSTHLWGKSEPPPPPFCEIFENSNHPWRSFQLWILPNTHHHPTHCSLCFLVSLTNCVITPDLLCYFAYWCYWPKPVKPWHLSISSTFLRILCNKESNLLKIWHWWHGFSKYSDLISQTLDTQGPIEWHSYISISYHYLLRPYNSYLYYIEWITCW